MSKQHFRSNWQHCCQLLRHCYWCGRRGFRFLDRPRVRTRSIAVDRRRRQVTVVTCRRQPQWERYFNLHCDRPTTAITGKGEEWLPVAPADRLCFSSTFLRRRAGMFMSVYTSFRRHPTPVLRSFITRMYLRCRDVYAAVLRHQR